MQNQSTAILVAIVGIISTAIGGLLTIAGNYITVRKSSQTEKRKFVREKIEEIYSLVDQIFYSTLHHFRNCTEKYGLKIMDTGEYFHYYAPKEFDDLNLPMEKLNMLIGLYAPSAKPHFRDYNITIQEALKIIDYFIKNEMNKSFEDFAKIHYDIFHLRKYNKSIKAHDKISEEYLLLIHTSLITDHDILQDALEKQMKL